MADVVVEPAMPVDGEIVGGRGWVGLVKMGRSKAPSSVNFQCYKVGMDEVIIRSWSTIVR